MIRKLLSDRVLFTLGVVCLVWSEGLAPSEFDAVGQDLKLGLWSVGIVLTAYALWGLVASLRPVPKPPARVSGSESHEKGRDAV
jgi:hypothetical protein